MNTLPASIESLERQIAILQNRRDTIRKLQEERNAIEEKIDRVAKGEEDRDRGNKKPRRRIPLPRGVLTLAAFDAIQKNQKPMRLDEIVQEVKKSPLLGGNIPNDLYGRVRGVLLTSNQFKNEGKATFTTRESSLKGKLFERLMQETSK